VAACCLEWDPPADFGEFLATSSLIKARAEIAGDPKVRPGRQRSDNPTITW